MSNSIISSASVDSVHYGPSCWDCINCKKAYKASQKKAKQEDDSFYPAAFLPKFVLNGIKLGLLNTLPSSLELSAILLSIEIPIARELTDIYLDKTGTKGNVVYDVKAFFVALIEVLHKKGADIYLIVDAVVHCCWKVKNFTYEDMLLSVLELVLYLRDKFASKHSTSCWKFKLKFVIAAGEIKVVFLGDPTKRIMWCILGETVLDLQKCLPVGEVDDIILTYAAWRLLKGYQDSFASIQHGDHIKIKKQVSRKSKLLLLNQIAQSTFTPLKHTILDETESRGTKDEIFYWYDSFKPLIMKCVSPILYSVVTNQQLEILSSMTSLVTTAFYIPDDNLVCPETLDLILNKVMNITMHYEGTVSFLEYRQGILFGCLFGNVGFKHDNDCSRSLLWAHDTVTAVKELGHIGVARMSYGLCFSAIFGVRERKFCCLIGKPPFISIRLIHLFEDIPIVCDSNIAFRAGSEFGNIFDLIVKRTRGIKNIPPCFSVNFSKSKSVLAIKCINRKEEIVAVSYALKHLGNSESIGNKLPIIVVKGELGCGKTHFMKYILQEAPSYGVKLCCYLGDVLYDDKIEKSCYLVKYMLASDRMDNETDIVRLLEENIEKYPLHILNKVFGTKFPILCETTDVHNEIIQEMLVALLIAFAQKRLILIAIDDGEHMDEFISYFLQELLKYNLIIVMISFTTPLAATTSYIEHFMDKAFLVLPFGNLDEKAIISLSCHFLNVYAIQIDLFRFLVKHSQGNPLRLQEILLLPQVQHHLCFVEYYNFIPKSFQKSFVVPEENAGTSATEEQNTKICDLFDLDGLHSVHIPEHLIDIVRERTFGLAAEEQMLIKKCACLAPNFGLYVLEAVCPEYSSDMVRNSLVTLIKKNLLLLECEHFTITKYGINKIMQTDLAEEYCFHPVKFASNVFKSCVLNCMLPAQKERLHLFIISMLKEAKIVCDSCRILVTPYILESNECFLCDMVIPKLPIFNCHCMNFQLSIDMEILYHMKQTPTPVERLVLFMLKTAQFSLEAGKMLKVSELLDEVNGYLDNNQSEFCFPDLVKAFFYRVNSLKNIQLGKMKESKNFILKALKQFKKTFPTDYLKETSRLPNHTSCMKEEERCVLIGCKILLCETQYENAYIISKRLHANVKYKLGEADFFQVMKYPHLNEIFLKEHIMLVSAAKMPNRKKLNARVSTHLHRILDRCSTQMSKAYGMGVTDLRIIIRALIKTCFLLFEIDNLHTAEIIGFRIFRICHLTKGIRELNEFSPTLCLICYYTEDTGKYFEVLGGFLDNLSLSHDFAAEAMLHALSIKLLINMENPDIYKDRRIMCTNFAIMKYGHPFPGGFLNVEKKFWVSSLICLWCLHQNLTDVFSMWYGEALELESQIEKTCYWSFEAALYILLIKGIQTVQSVNLALNEVEQKLAAINEQIDGIYQISKICVPVLMSEIVKTKLKLKSLLHERVSTYNKKSDN